MKFRLNILFLSLILGLFSSCVDELIANNNGGKGNGISSGDPSCLDICLDNFGKRTRDVDFTEGSSVRINYVWLGVFDFETGDLVAKDFVNLDYTFVSSGEEAYGVIRHKLGKPSHGTEFFMVAVANYKDVIGHLAEDEHEGGTPLEELLDRVKTWAEFNEIGVGTASAYKDPHNLDTPVLAGFLNDKSAYNASISNSTHIRIDQFAQYNAQKNNEKGVYLLPEILKSEKPIKESLKIVWNEDIGKYVKPSTDDDTPETTLNHTIFFRRLVSNINIRIESGPNVEITKVYYRRFNIPRAVYIIERSMIDKEGYGGTKGKFPTDGKLSPNFADLGAKVGHWNDDDELLNNSSGQSGSEGSDDSDNNDEENDKGGNSDNFIDPEHPDENWQRKNTNLVDGVWTINFQHFANKHWARKTMNSYADREVISLDNDGNKYFSNLADSPEDINNYASYFILKLHIIDKTNNRCAEAEYTIHEGYTSNEEGEPQDNSYQDFSTARNINYTYNIKVNGFNDIVLNVNGTPADNHIHRSDEGGKVWQLHYANQTNSSLVGYEKESEDYYGAIGDEGGIFKDAFKVDSKNPNVAFRLYGYDSSEGTKAIRGYNYNFKETSFTYLDGIWPPSATNSNYYLNYDALVEDYLNEEKQTIETKLFETFKYIDAEKYNETYEVALQEYENDLKNGVDDENEKTYNGLTESQIIEYKKNWLDLVQLIMEIEKAKEDKNENEKITKTYHLKVAPREIGPVDEVEKKNYIRAIYLCDRNGKVDGDGCSTLVDLYAAVQDPPTYSSIQATPIFKDEYYRRLKINQNTNETDPNMLIHYVRTTALNNWTGSINGIAEIGFDIAEDLGATQYRIIVYDENMISKTTKVFNKADLKKLNNYNNYYIFPVELNWSDIKAGGIYNVALSLENPQNKKEGSILGVSVEGKLKVYNSEWDFSNDFWQRYSSLSTYNTLFEVNLSKYVDRLPSDSSKKKFYSKEKNFFMEDNGLELGVFELSVNSSIINSAGYLYTIADFSPTDLDKDAYLPLKGNSFQMKLSASKSGKVLVHMVNTKNTEAADKKVLKIKLGKKLSGDPSKVTKPSNGTVTYDSNNRTYTYTNYPTSRTTISFPVTVVEGNSDNPEDYEITLSTVLHVGWFYSIKYE